MAHSTSFLPILPSKENQLQASHCFKQLRAGYISVLSVKSISMSSLHFGIKSSAYFIWPTMETYLWVERTQGTVEGKELYKDRK